MSAPRSNTYLLEDMEAVRQSGLVNMTDRVGVAEVAIMLDLDELADHLEGMQPNEYAAFIKEFSAFLRGEET